MTTAIALTLFGVGILVAVGLCTRDKEKQLGGCHGDWMDAMAKVRNLTSRLDAAIQHRDAYKERLAEEQTISDELTTDLAEVRAMAGRWELASGVKHPRELKKLVHELAQLNRRCKWRMGE